MEGFFGKIFLGRISWRIFGRIFWRIFWRIVFGGILWEEFFGRNSLFYFNVEGIDLFVKILGKGRRRKEVKFQSLKQATTHLKTQMQLHNVFRLIMSKS